ncbi:hypothetical protein [Neobacillus terrae]|uniref:hypothetical protein n=1 Tax=Neobacillus terrae TaxID=3034837 RepID=UPI0014094E85|nr:hypothetical protein [Neobacillus terrae]NHM29369.1 hypothetical protein [Neobacillus terrae]
MGLKQQSLDGLFLGTLNALASKGAQGDINLRKQCISYARDLLNTETGFETALYYAPLFEQAGLFSSTPWGDPVLLKPGLVRGTLLAGGLTAVCEMLSDIRVLAISIGIFDKTGFSREAASRFIDKVLVLNLDLVFPKINELTRLQNRDIETLNRFFTFIAKYHASPEIFDKFIIEIEELSAQRPIVNNKIVTMIEAGETLSKQTNRIPHKYLLFKNALHTPTKLSQLHEDHYMACLSGCNENELKAEAGQFAESMFLTGIVSNHHVSITKFLSENYPHLLGDVLGLGQNGRNQLLGCLEEIRFLIDKSLIFTTHQSVYGLSKLIEENIMSEDILYSLRSLASVPISITVQGRIEKSFEISPSEVRAVIIAGAICLLGSPLGIAQGHNPTCQSTRALSYWAQTHPLYLLELLSKAVALDHIEMEFEGIRLSSSLLEKYSLNLSIPMDPVSVILLPHLHCVYNEMLKMAGGRKDDPHKWVNPAFYGPHVLSGFSSIYNDLNFYSHFRKYYHPASHFAIHDSLPQPAGIFILDDKGNNMGAHAILIQRVGIDQDQISRVYFYNPNNDSRQTWAGSIVTSVKGNGELEGEASLPFEDFISCLYAFHYPEETS